MRPTGVSFVPEVLRALAAAPQRPIKLTDAQRDEVCRAVRGSLRHDLCNAQMESEMSVSYWNDKRDTIAVVRYNKNRKDFVWVSFDSAGRLFGDGGGHDPISLPWTK